MTKREKRSYPKMDPSLKAFLASLRSVAKTSPELKEAWDKVSFVKNDPADVASAMVGCLVDLWG